MFCRLLLPLLLAGVTGCAGVDTVDDGRLRLGSPEFRDYVERVFREQNRLADELAFALVDLPEPDGPRGRALTEAEDRLRSACEPLNALALARRDERRLGPFAQARLARRAPECEAAADATQAVLGPRQ